MRQHALGPYPFDPNLIAQGIPPDDRITFQDHIYGPLEGTPMPPPGPAAADTGPADGAVPPPPVTPAAGASVAPSAFAPDAGGPSVAIATYDPKTGQFATPDGTVARQTDVIARDGEQSWTDLLPTG